MRTVVRSAASSIALSVLAVLAAACNASQPLDWEAVEAIIAEQFPDVPTVTTTELSASLASDPEGVVILDARAPGEFAVSHLPGARHVGDDADAAGRLAAAAPGARAWWSTAPSVTARRRSSTACASKATPTPST